MTSFTVAFVIRFLLRLEISVIPAPGLLQTRTHRRGRFEKGRRGHSKGVPAERQPRPVPEAKGRRGMPTLIFVSRRRSGVSRKMESLVAWVKVTEKKRLRVVDLDVDRSPELAHHLGVRAVPSLLVFEHGRVVGRLEGRATGRQIDELIRPYLAPS
jgi:Thioredoxin